MIFMHEKIVELLSQTEDYISGQELSTQLGVSRQAVWKAINTLKSQGYVFDSITRKGYKLVAYPEHLNTYAVKSHLNTNLIGKNLIVVVNRVVYCVPRAVGYGNGFVYVFPPCLI